MIKNHISQEDNYRKRGIIETIIYFLIVYGISLLFGIFFYLDRSLDPELLVYFMMLLPATGVSLAKLYKDKKMIKTVLFILL